MKKSCPGKYRFRDCFCWCPRCIPGDFDGCLFTEEFGPYEEKKFLSRKKPAPTPEEEVNLRKYYTRKIDANTSVIVAIDNNPTTMRCYDIQLDNINHLVSQL